jgi:uncharacterized protein (TIGR03086 family)
VTGMEPTELLGQTFDQVQTVVDGVEPAQMEAPTPCKEWDVRDLLNHMTGTVVMFGNALSGGDAPPEGDLVGDDPAGVFRRETERTLAAWRQPGAMDQTLNIPVGELPGSIAINVNLMDSYVHGLDLAVATGQEDKIDPAMAEARLTLAKEMGLDNFRMPGVFGPEAPCDESAAAHRRLLAYLGREV